MCVVLVEYIAWLMWLRFHLLPSLRQPTNQPTNQRINQLATICVRDSAQHRIVQCLPHNETSIWHVSMKSSNVSVRWSHYDVLAGSGRPPTHGIYDTIHNYRVDHTIQTQSIPTLIVQRAGCNVNDTKPTTDHDECVAFEKQLRATMILSGCKILRIVNAPISSRSGDILGMPSTM
jgi:hypothetical protein